jgi:hypothetical protein
MTIHERLNALTMRRKRFSRDLENMRAKAEADDKRNQERLNMLITTAQHDGENIRALARIAEIQERRLTDLEGH